MTLRLLSVLLCLLGLLAGCGPEPRPGPKRPKAEGAKQDREKEEEDHSHGPGPHGGRVADWAGGKYHIELVVDREKKTARVYVLDGRAKKAMPLKLKDGQLTMAVTEHQGKEAFTVPLKAQPQKNDPEGASSLYVGTHEQFGVERGLYGTVTGEMGGRSYSGDYEEPAPAKGK